MKVRRPSSPRVGNLAFFRGNRERLAGSGAAMSPGRLHGCWRNLCTDAVDPTRNTTAASRPSSSDRRPHCENAPPRRCPFFYPSEVHGPCPSGCFERRLKETAPSTNEHSAQGRVEQSLSARGATVNASSGRRIRPGPMNPYAAVFSLIAPPSTWWNSQRAQRFATAATTTHVGLPDARSVFANSLQRSSQRIMRWAASKIVARR